MARPATHKGANALGRSIAQLSTKERLARKLNDTVEARKLGQSEVARLLGMPHPKISAIRNYKLGGISLQRLLQGLTALGKHVEIVVSQSSEASHARIDVAA